MEIKREDLKLLNLINMKGCYYLFISLFLWGCAGEKKQSVEYADATYKLLDDEIATTMPGTLRVAGDFLVWEDPFARDYFVHVHEKETGHQVGAMGKVGEGPREFVTGGINGACIDNRYFAMDINGKTRGFLSIDSLVQGKDPFVPLTDQEKASRPPMPEFAKDLYIGITDDDAEHCFEALLHGQASSFGNYPIPQVKQYLGGEREYNASRGVFVYSCYDFPYLALYQQDEDEFSLVWEWRTDDDEYEIRNNEILFDRRVKGVRGLCMSKDFIITLQRDRRTDDTDESTVGRDASKCPRTVFLYDYDGNLVKIVDLGIPVMRIAAESKDNTLYAIGVNPDFVLVKYEL